VRLAGLSFLAFCAFAQSAAGHMAEGRIVGGQAASRSYPYAALLRITYPAGQARCGGSLIAARYIVTAAHCMNNDGTPPISIEYALGNVDASAAPYKPISEPPIVHPNFSGQAGGGWDAALLHLPAPASGEAPRDEQLQLLRPGDTPLWQPGTTATVIGWGLTEDQVQGGRASNQLLEVGVPVFSDADCNSDFTRAGAPSGFFDPQTEVCAGGKDGKDSCNGDSGGPLLVPVGDRLALAGLVSFGAVLRDAQGNEYSCAENLPGVYTRIAADPMNNWVRSIVPQAEIDVSPAQPEPDQTVTLSSASTPGYDTLEWDLDGDGNFGDATGTSVTRAYAAGNHTIALRASNAAKGDREIRRITLQ
jgi:secreted trypsin-like serine protease